MFGSIKRFLQNEEGATMVEYGIMVSMIAVVCLAVVAAIGDGVFDSFDQTNTAVQTQGNTPQAPTTPAD
jgi:pilus assembly protein Flp/PilA